MFAPRSSVMIMEHTLRCNHLKCRKELDGHAVVTTCSHVFCIDCSNCCQLSGQRDSQGPVCPACSMHLPNPDDVVVTNLNPTEDYKTSVLSGLNPNIVIECARRALGFWAYQTTQEIVYQEYLAKNLADKYASLNTQMDKIVHDANAEISSLRNKISNLQLDQENLKRKNEELMQAFREKSRKQLQTQELYDKLKQRAMLGQVQNAASNAVGHSIQSSITANRLTNRIDDQNQRPPQPPLFSSMQDAGVQLRHPNSNNTVNMANLIGRSETGDWAGFRNSQESVAHNQRIQTPSTHRQRLSSRNDPTPRIGLSSLQLNSVGGTPGTRKSPSDRPPLSNLNGNHSGFSGYGMSAGLKVSNPPTTAINGYAGPILGPRVAQRPLPRLSATHSPSFGLPPTGNMFSNGDGLY